MHHSVIKVVDNNVYRKYYTLRTFSVDRSKIKVTKLHHIDIGKCYKS